MSIDNLERAIQQANAEITQIRQNAELIVSEINQVVPTFLSEWTTYLVGRSIQDHPDVVRELGAEKIGQLKKGLSEFTASLPNTAQERLASIKWIHQMDISQKEIDANVTLAYDLSKQANTSLDEVIREVIGRVGALLIEFGITKQGQNTEWQIKSGQVRYSYGIPDHPPLAKGSQLRNMRERYSKIVEEYVRAIKALKKAEKDKSIAEAKNLWDNA